MKKKFMKMGLTESLAKDFEWIVWCAACNAECGYGVRQLFLSNDTVRTLMEVSNHRMTKMIEIAGLIGWYQCAEDKQEENKYWKMFAEEAKARGYAS